MKSSIPIEVIEKNIFLIRGQKVIPDKVLAELYGVETRVLNQAVKRNLKRFPADFMFELDRAEIKRISQIVISLKFSKRVWVFTEQGVAMLSGLLNSERAVMMNIAIMRAFVRLRQMIAAHKELAEKLSDLEKKVKGQDQKILEILTYIKNLLDPIQSKPKKRIGFH
ncbi:MAG: ORF6N domain-containing protein [Candidatus Omnitrophica bacterium]|nr:ORF6N domain-containing protein [Candidatus Omnitrophota bacterium]